MNPTGIATTRTLGFLASKVNPSAITRTGAKFRHKTGWPFGGNASQSAASTVPTRKKALISPA